MIYFTSDKTSNCLNRCGTAFFDSFYRLANALKFYFSSKNKTFFLPEPKVQAFLLVKLFFSKKKRFGGCRLAWSRTWGCGPQNLGSNPSGRLVFLLVQLFFSKEKVLRGPSGRPSKFFQKTCSQNAFAVAKAPEQALASLIIWELS